MIRLACPRCLLTQDFPDRDAGLDRHCGWCNEPLNVGGPAAEFLPPSEPARPGSVSEFVGRTAASFCSALAFVLALLAVVVLPVFDFGFGYRIAGIRPAEFFWLVLLAAYGFQFAGEKRHRVTPVRATSL